jgi:hypothetical protein
MTAARGYFVDGVELVGVREVCECCDRRPAVGRSISGLAICAPCARDASQAAAELAREVAQ